MPCSYCFEEGHYVTTCKQKQIDDQRKLLEQVAVEFVIPAETATQR